MAFITTGTSAEAHRPDLSVIAPEDAVPEALILQHSTNAGFVDGDAPAVRAAVVTDDAASFVLEATQVPEGDPVLGEKLIWTSKLGLYASISSEQYRTGSTAGLLSTSVRRSIVKAADSAFVSQVAPTSPAVAPVAGLTATAGAIAGGAVDADLDILIDLIAELESAGATPSAMLLSPTAHASLQKLRVATGSNQSLLGAGVEAGERRLLSLPVTVTNALAANSGLILDRTAILSATGPVNVAVSEHQLFASDSIAMRITWRTGHVVTHPDRLGTFTVTPAV